MKEKLRYCIEYINPQFPLLDSGNLNIRHLRLEQEHFAEIAIDLILSFGGKIISTYKGSVTRGRVADWDAHLELDDKFSGEWLESIIYNKQLSVELPEKYQTSDWTWEDKTIDQLAEEYVKGVKKCNDTPTWDLIHTAVCHGYELGKNARKQE